MDMHSDEYKSVRCNETTFASCYSKSGNGISKCNVRRDCNESPVVFCKTCGKMMCKQCHTYHETFCEDHDVQLISDRLKTQLHFSCLCPHDSEEQTNSYCMGCELLLCSRCANEDHRNHDVVDSDIAVADTQTLHKTLLDNCEVMSEKAANTIDAIQKRIGLHDDVLEETVVQFSNFVEKLKNELEKKKNKEIISKADKVKSTFEKEQEFWKNKLEALTYISFCIKCSDDKGNRKDCLSQRKNLRIMWNLIDDQHYPSFTYPGVSSFTRSDAFMRLIEEMSLGILHIASNENETRDNDIVRLDTDGTVTSSYCDIIESQIVGQREIATNRERAAHDVACVSSDFPRPADVVLDFEDAHSGKVAFSLDPHTHTFHISLKDKEEKAKARKEHIFNKSHYDIAAQSSHCAKDPSVSGRVCEYECLTDIERKRAIICSSRNSNVAVVTDDNLAYGELRSRQLLNTISNLDNKPTPSEPEIDHTSGKTEPSRPIVHASRDNSHKKRSILHQKISITTDSHWT